MRVERLELTHFRGIEHLVLDFLEPVTVLVGMNGAGKTSILEALRALLAHFQREVQAEVASGAPGHLEPPGGAARFPFLGESDLQVGQRDFSLFAQFVLPQRSPPALKLVLRGRPALPGEIDLHAETDDLLTVARKLKHTVAHEPLAALPLAIYYAAGRGTARDDAWEQPPGRPPNQLSAYEDALTGNAIVTAATFVEWFRQREDYENEQRLENGAYRDAQLQAVRQAVKELLPGFGDLRIRRQPIRMVIRKGDTELLLRHLSDGERYLLALGADIARRLALANPAAPEPRLCSAVILIDEIESHLHPSWQRRILPALERAFPRCQLIATTHSPQVLSQVRPERIYLLRHEAEKLEAWSPKASFGRDSNQILMDILEADERPGEVKQKLSQYFLLIAQGNLQEARELRRNLEESIGPDEPEFARADVLLRAKELLAP